MLTPSGSRVCAEAGVPAANAAAVANPSDSADLLSIFVIAVPFGCFGPLGQSLGPWFAKLHWIFRRSATKDLHAGLVQNLAKVPGGKCPQRVIHVGLTVRRPLPVYPGERTFSGLAGMSQRCQQRTRAPQQTASLFTPLLRSKQSSKRKGRLYFTLAQTGWAVDEEAVPQSLGTAVRTKPRRSRALRPSEGSWFSRERRSR